MKKNVVAVITSIILSWIVGVIGGDVNAQDAKPAIIYGIGEKNDRSFNESAFLGAERFTKDTGIKYREFVMQTNAQREQAMRRFARDGHNPIIAIGFDHAPALNKVAQEFPNTNFAIVDAVVKQPNVRSIVFSEHEGSYLVGMLAAMASKTNKVGFVGGMDIPLIRKFACGYVQGVKSVNPSAEVFQNMIGTTPAAWGDPVKGAELTQSQIDRGADVVYHAAGGSGVGVLQAAADNKKLGIGADANQNYMQPGYVLTSSRKRVDNAVYKTFRDVKENKWSAGVVVLGLKEGGVGYAIDEHNRHLVSEDMENKVNDAILSIKNGKVVVHNYMVDNNCPDG